MSLWNTLWDIPEVCSVTLWGLLNTTNVTVRINLCCHRNNSDRRIYSYVTAVPRRGSLEEDGGVVGQMEKPRFRTACKVLPLQLRDRLLAWNPLVYLFSPPLPSSQPPAVMRSKDLTYICWINKWSQGSELVVLEIHCHKQTLSCVKETLAFY